MDQNLNPKEKKSGFGKGLGLGVVIGAIGILLCLTLVVAGYTRLSGNIIAIGSKSVKTVTTSQLIDRQTAQKLDEIMHVINVNYMDEIDEQALREGMYHGLVNALGDPYTVYYTKEEFDSFSTSSSGNYAGIGAVLTKEEDTGRIRITKIYRNTPAESAGLREDDIITKIDGVDSSTYEELAEATSHIKGEEGTTVTLTIYRGSTSTTMDVVVERQIISLPSVESNMLDNGIGYIQVIQFQEDTTNQFSQALKDLEAQGMEKLVIDLRDNPGGMLSTVCEMLDIVLPEGTVVSTKDKYGNEKSYPSDARCINYPMVVLINENSASASEIFAGAIKDFEYGTLIGTKTFGKGIVQSVLRLSDGDGIKVTTSKYYTPNGYNIHGIGIEPDITLEYEFLGGEEDVYEQRFDNQLIYAQNYLLGLTN